MWLVFAFGSALFAGLTSILAKCGIKKTDSDVATGIRTIIVLMSVKKMSIWILNKVKESNAHIQGDFYNF